MNGTISNMTKEFLTLFSKAAASACAVVVLMAITVSLRAADLGDLLQRKATAGNGDHAEVATKVAEFKDTFSIGGLSFSADGSKIVTSGVLAPPELHIWRWKDGAHRFQSLAMMLSAGDTK